MANIARLGVALGLNSAEFVSGINAAGQKLEQFANKAAGYGKVAATAFVAMTVAAMAYADEITDVAKANDVAIDSIIKLQNALANSGGSADSAGKLLSSFSKFVDDAAGGSFEAQQKLSKLGVSLTDIGNLSTDTLFQKTIKGLAVIEDSLTRSARGMDAFGKAGKGVDWIGVAEGMANGAAASKKQAQAVEDAAAAFDMLKQAGRDVNLVFVEELGSSLKLTGEYIKDLTNGSNLLGNAFKVVFQTIAVLGSNLVFIFSRISDEIAHTIENAKILTTEGMQAAIAANKAYEKRRQQSRADLDLFEARIMGTGSSNAGSSAGRGVGFQDSRIVTGDEGPQREVKTPKEVLAKGFELEKARLENQYAITNNLIKRYELEASQIKKEQEKADAQARLEIKQKNISEENKFTIINSEILNEKLIANKKQYNEKIAALQFNYKQQEIAKEFDLDKLRLENKFSITNKFLNESQIIEIEYASKTAQATLENKQKNIQEENQFVSKNALALTYKLAAIDADYLEKKKARADKYREDEARQQVDMMNEIQEVKNKQQDKDAQRQIYLNNYTNQSRAQLVNLEMAQEMFLIEQKSRYMKSEDVQLEKELLQIKYKYDEVVLSIYKNEQLTEDGKEIAYALENRNQAIAIGLAKDRLQLLKDQKSGGVVEGFLFRMNTFGKDMETSFEAGGKAFDSLMGSMTKALDDFVTTGKLDFENFAKSIIKDMLAIQLRASATNLFSMLAKSFASTVTGGSPTYSSMPAGVRADGGPVESGSPYVVGERGPELFVPRSAGAIVPNHSMAMMGGSTNNITNYNIQAIDTKSFEDRILGSSKAVWAANAYGAKNLSLGRGRT